MYIFKLAKLKRPPRRNREQCGKLRLVNCLQIILLGVSLSGQNLYKSIALNIAWAALHSLWSQITVNTIFKYGSSFKMWYIWIICGIDRITDSQVTFWICLINISKCGAWTCTFHKYPQWISCSKWKWGKIYHT